MREARRVDDVLILGEANWRDLHKIARDFIKIRCNRADLFVIAAKDYETFADAILKKLIAEIATVELGELAHVNIAD